MTLKAVVFFSMGLLIVSSWILFIAVLSSMVENGYVSSYGWVLLLILVFNIIACPMMTPLDDLWFS